VICEQLGTLWPLHPRCGTGGSRRLEPSWTSGTGQPHWQHLAGDSRGGGVHWDVQARLCSVDRRSATHKQQAVIPDIIGEWRAPLSVDSQEKVRSAVAILSAVVQAGCSRTMSQCICAQSAANSTMCGAELWQGSFHMLRLNRPAAGLELPWTWSSSATEGRPISSIAWNPCNQGLLAAGYGNKPAAAPASEAAAPADAAAEGEGPPVLKQSGCPGPAAAAAWQMAMKSQVTDDCLAAVVASTVSLSQGGMLYVST